MKTNRIVKREDVDGTMFTLTFEFPISDFDAEQIGGCILGTGTERGQGWVNTTSTDLMVNDAITDEFGGRPVIAEAHGEDTKTHIAAKESDYRKSWCEKRGLRY